MYLGDSSGFNFTVVLRRMKIGRYFCCILVIFVVGMTLLIDENVYCSVLSSLKYY